MHFAQSRQIARQLLIAGSLVLVAAGCAIRPGKTPPPPAAKTQPPASPVAVTPAKILLVSSEHQFVVLDFGGQFVPRLGTRLTVQRDGKPVGAVRVTGPVRGMTAVADIVEGELRAGDEAR